MNQSNFSGHQDQYRRAWRGWMGGDVQRMHQRPMAFSAEEILPAPKDFAKPVSELAVPGTGVFPCLRLPRWQELLVVLQ